MQELRTQLVEARTAFASGLRDASVDEQGLRSLHERMLEIRRKLTDARFEQMLKIRALLGPDQIASIPEPRMGRRNGRGKSGLGNQRRLQQ